MLVMDQKVTTQPVLGELDTRGVKFLTLRMRSPALSATSTAWPRRLQDDHPGPARPATADPGSTKTAVKRPATPAPSASSSSPASAATPHRDHHQRPTTTTAQLISRYARRMTIEQRLAEIIRAFCADALSSTVNLNVDLDIMLAVLAQALLAALRARLPGYHNVTPDISNAGSSKPPGRSPPPATPSPSASNAAPTHPSYAKPPSPRHPHTLVGNRVIRYELA